mgnify:CR=1 FL=1
MGWGSGNDSVRVGSCGLGRGLFAGRGYDPGELILVLCGARYGRDDPIHGTPGGANLLQTGWRTYILLEPPGVFANHSCNPNAGIRGNRRLVAIRPIAAGDEIRFDYSTTMAENFWTMPCRCGDPACRGVVEDFARLPRLIQDRYLRLGIVQGFIARDQQHIRAAARRTAAPCRTV